VNPTAHRIGCAFCAFLWLITFLRPVPAEQLPVKIYTTADGLARDRVYKIVADPRGYLWFCTNDGVSRFDGYEFTNYTTANGLPHRVVNDLLITKEGDYWVATNFGVARFNPQATTPSAKFQAYPSTSGRPGSEVVDRLYEDTDGTIWGATTNGLHRLREVSGNWQLEYVSVGEKIDDRLDVNAIIEDSPGVLWVGTGFGLYRRFKDGAAEHFTTAHGLPHNAIRVAFKDRDGSVWLGTGVGLVHLRTNIRAGESIVEKSYTTKDGLLHDSVYSIIRTRSNWLWVATGLGLSEFSPEPLADGGHFRNYSGEHQFSDFGIRSIAEDRDGNLWLGTESGGAMKVTRHGFISYSEDDGLEVRRIAALGEDREGNFYAVTGSLGAPSYYVNRFDGRRFQKTRINLPAGVIPTWGWDQIVMQDRAGEWWVPTTSGLYHFHALSSLQNFATARPRDVYTTEDGLSGSEPFRLYEDSRGDLWIGIISLPSPAFLNRWERATRTIHSYTSSDVSLATSCPTAFQEDRNQNVWMGFYWGGLARYRNGRFDVFTKDDGVPPGLIRDLHLDSSGRLWVASSDGGLSRVDDPTVDRPTFITYTKKEGLSSDLITSVTEDQWGRIYLGTGVGVDRLDPATGRVKRYTTADGLANSYVNVSFRDRNGTLWFGTMQGLSKLVVEPDKSPEPPPILIQGLRAAGSELPISELGVKEAGGFEFEATRNRLEIKFLSLGFRPGEVLRYQFMLEGADNDWGTPIDQRTVTYANLKPGNYRFVVRAINADGVVSAEPAAISFRIIPAVWQRWWFVALVLVLLAAITHLIYRYHTRRLIELERVRTRIATELHDDIGASLSKIAILSDIAGREAAVAKSSVTGSLAQIADTSRDALDSMSDIVWAVNPQRDHLSDLIQRMRRFAEDLLDARDIEFTFRAPVDEKDIRLEVDLRREVYLIFKECVNNLVKHSDCTRAELDFRISGPWLVFSMNDNGSGFEPANVKGGMGGHGLASIQRRAQALGGSLKFEDNGRRVTLRVPLHQRQGWLSWFSNYPNGR
jgi:ligand-binding sensor domain-containing protein/signal transduction histidine kinase